MVIFFCVLALYADHNDFLKNNIAVILMVRYEVFGFREQGTGNREQRTVAGRPEMMPNQVILYLYEKRYK
jgi:hypothetical protein